MMFSMMTSLVMTVEVCLEKSHLDPHSQAAGTL